MPQVEARARRGEARRGEAETYIPQAEARARARRGEARRGEARPRPLSHALAKALAPTLVVEPDHGEGGPQGTLGRVLPRAGRRTAEVALDGRLGLLSSLIHQMPWSH